jgi:hypothetical protein
MITIAEQPNSLGSYRYDVTIRGSSTHGFRQSIVEARRAAHEDASLLAFCTHTEAEEVEVKDSRRERT